ncbi:GyrI-like domain-containing protein [Agromyces mediolanus]|uniref:hypothetical protein n=1 Tax=Agromyces mediolanus TaxID=41986 RepID=UPI0038359312
MTVVELVRMPPRLVIGVPVLAPFDRLSTLVPAAWTRAFAEFAGDGRPFAEASTRVGGQYHEVVGVLAALDARRDGFVHALVPGGEYAYLEHRGPRAGIAGAFGEIEDWLRAAGRTAGAAKLDVGYRADGSDQAHELFVSLAS